ncbi:extracellular solute-binding protein [Actinokineospora sp. NPDC004072]
MDEPPRRWNTLQRAAAVVAVIAAVLLVTTVSALLVSDVDYPWSWSSIGRALAAAGPLVASGIAINFLPKVVAAAWRGPEPINTGLVDAAARLRTALRKPARLVGVLLAVVAIVAVGLALRPTPTGLERGTLVLMAAYGDSTNDPRTMLIRQWNQLHPQTPVRVENVSGEPDAQHEAMVDDARRGRAADVYAIDLPWMTEFVERGYIQPIGEVDTADFVEKVIDTCRHEGTLWGLPLNSDAGLLFYRSDLVAAPQTWDDYFGPAARAAAVEAGVEAANAAQLADEEVLTITAMEAMLAADGTFVAANGQVPLTPDRSQVAFSRADLAAVEKLAAAADDSRTVLVDRGGGATEREAAEAFRDGRALYMRNWAVTADLLDRNPDLEYQVVAPPTPSVLGGQNLVISAATDMPRAAKALIEFLTSASSQMILAEFGGYAPTRHSAYANSTREYKLALLESVQRARLRPLTPHYTEFSKAFRTGIARALNNDGKLEPGFARELAEILQRP